MSKTQNAATVQKQQDTATGQSPNVLAKMGGFSFVESIVDGIANMNPERKARKQIFLTDSNKEAERKELLKKNQSMD